MQVPAAWKTLHVQSCLVGQVHDDSNMTCTVCGNSTFSLDPLRTSCDPCPSGAVCYGADAFIPPEHSWHSGPNSTTILTCPNADACEGNRTTLLACKQVKRHSLCSLLHTCVAASGASVAQLRDPLGTAGVAYRALHHVLRLRLLVLRNCACILHFAACAPTLAFAWEFQGGYVRYFRDMTLAM